MASKHRPPKYVPNTASMASFLMSGRVSRVSQQAAQAIARDAAMLEGARPKRGRSTGRLAAGFKVRGDVGGRKAAGGARRVGIVYNNVRYAAALEFGTSEGTPGTHVLARASLPYHVPKAMRGPMAQSGGSS